MMVKDMEPRNCIRIFLFFADLMRSVIEGTAILCALFTMMDKSGNLFNTLNYTILFIGAIVYIGLTLFVRVYRA